MNILEHYTAIQELLFGQTPCELLELRYSAYAFGSGYVAFRVKGRNFIITFDGRDNALTIQVADKPYPTKDWKLIWTGKPDNLNQSFKMVTEYLI